MGMVFAGNPFIQLLKLCLPIQDHVLAVGKRLGAVDLEADPVIQMIGLGGISRPLLTPDEDIFVVTLSIDVRQFCCYKYSHED